MFFNLLKNGFYVAVFLVFAPALLYGQNLTVFDLPVREDIVEEDSTESDWLSDTSSMDTIEYHALDLEYDVFTSTFNLNTDARLSFKTATLDADTILYNQESEILVASGNPIIREGKGQSLASMRMKYNLNTKVGELYYATTFQDNNQVNGMEVRRLQDTRMLIARGDFSTCDDTTHQHYYFYGRRMVVKPKESITVRPVVLNIADVPVAVLPMVVAPLKSGRKSGLLTPKFGGDQVQGYYMSNLGFYYAASDYLDATFKGDIIEGEEARFEKTTLTGELRYKIRYKLDGSISYTSYLEEFDLSNSGYDITFSHNQNLTPDGRHTLSGSGSFVSSQKVRKDNGLDAETILNQQANAQMTYAGKFGTNKTLTVKTQQQYNLVTGNLERQLPDVQYKMSDPLFEFETDEDEVAASDDSFEAILEKFNYSFTNRFNFYTKTARDTVADEDTTARYIGYTGSFSLDYKTTIFDVINLTPKASFTGYWSGRRYVNPEDSLKYRRSTFNFDPADGEFGEAAYNHNYSLTADTKLYGIWVPEIGRFTGVRHVLSPSISYTYAPEIDTVKTFAPHPLLGQTPYQSKQQTIGFSLSNDFDIKYLLKGGGASLKDTSSKNDDKYETRRLFTTSHTTSYNFAADSLNWSDINSSFGFQILKDYLFTVKTVHSVYHKYENDPNKVRIPQLTKWSYELSKSFNFNGELNAGLPSQMGKYEMNKWSAGFTYRYTYSSTRVAKNLFRDDISHATSINASFQPSSEWLMTYSTTYNYNEGRFVSHTFTFDRTLHCWKLDFTWTPTGPAEGWSLSIYVKDLPDIKLNAGSTSTD